jgi:hypothetical protein
MQSEHCFVQVTLNTTFVQRQLSRLLTHSFADYSTHPLTKGLTNRLILPLKPPHVCVRVVVSAAVTIKNGVFWDVAQRRCC